MSLKFWGQDEIKEGQQAIFWYLFLTDSIPDSPNNFFNEFIHSDNFKEDCLPFIVKKSIGKNDRFLKHAFNANNLTIADFKILSNAEILHFFDEYSKDSKWGDDKDDFIVIMNRFSTLIRKETSDKFFLISKEWFDKANKILNEDSDIYLYYFLIIWLDVDNKMVNVCEWNYD
jgi:hypothetical protein